MYEEIAKEQAECASSAQRNTSWKGIDFARCERKVRKIQIRIAKAQKEGRYNKVKALQHFLTTSFETKVLAVRRVTSNKGKRTPRFVGHRYLNARCCKFFETQGYKSLPLKRGNIPKKNRKMRPLGIPSLKDRVMQDLYLMAFEPVAGSTADNNSYSFRKYVVQQILLMPYTDG